MKILFIDFVGSYECTDLYYFHILVSLPMTLEPFGIREAHIPKSINEKYFR